MNCVLKTTMVGCMQKSIADYKTIRLQAGFPGYDLSNRIDWDRFLIKSGLRAKKIRS